MIHGEIVRPGRRPKCNRGKIGWPAIAIGARDESNDLCAHENPSQTAIATTPANESDIKYAVTMASTCMNEMCGMIAFAIISGANPIPPSAIRMADRRGGAAGERGPGHAACRHVRACQLIEYDPEKWEAVFRRDIAQLQKARTAARLRRVLRHCADMGRMWRHEILSAVRFKKPATGFPARA